MLGTDILFPLLYQIYKQKEKKKKTSKGSEFFLPVSLIREAHLFYIKQYTKIVLIHIRTGTDNTPLNEFEN